MRSIPKSLRQYQVESEASCVRTYTLRKNAKSYITSRINLGNYLISKTYTKCCSGKTIFFLVDSLQVHLKPRQLLI